MAGTEPKKRSPHVVFILADDMGYGDARCYNPEGLTPTPNIDRLAREGVRFTDAHSGGAVCTPTRYGFITGQHMWRTPAGHGVLMPYEAPIVDPDRLTIAKMLRERGYETSMVGKWHLGMRYPSKKKFGKSSYTTQETMVDFSKPLEGGPVDCGFDFFFGSAGCSSSDSPYAYIHQDRTVGIPDRLTPQEWNTMPGFYPGLVAPGWELDDVDVTFTREAVGCIDRYAESKSDKPLFLYFALNTPHVPWVVPSFIQGGSGEGSRGDMNALADWAVGRIYETLQKHGILDDTLLIFSSDNGPHAGSNGHDSTGGLRGTKNTPYEGGHREPFVARWPGNIAPGRVDRTTVSLTDMMATLAELTGFELPECAAEDSFSFLPAILGSGPCASTSGMINNTSIGSLALRCGKWKFINHRNRDTGEEDKRELFNLEDDLYETTDLSGTLPGLADRLNRHLGRLRQVGGRFVMPLKDLD